MLNANEYEVLWNRFVKKLSDDEVERVAKVASPIIKRGNKIIYPQRKNEWEACVNTRVCSIYDGDEVKNAIDVMELLDKNATFEHATDTLFNYAHTPFSINIALNIIATFSKVGPDYLEKLAEIAPEFAQKKEYLDKIKAQNAEFEKELSASQPGDENN